MVALRYSCNYAGECEVDDQGEFASEAACLVNCAAQEAKEINYLIFEYDWEAARVLAPSDLVAVVRRITGATIARGEVRCIFEAMILQDYELLALVDVLLPWIRRVHPYSLLFEVPIGSLSPEQVVTFPILSDVDITALVVAQGLPLANLIRGDVVRLMDIPVNQGRYVSYNSASELVERTAYQGYARGSVYAINNFPRVDYFRYTLLGNAVVFRKEGLAQFADLPVTRITSKVWALKADLYTIYTKDIEALRIEWNRYPVFAKLYFHTSWLGEGGAFDLYSDPQ